MNDWRDNETMEKPVLNQNSRLGHKVLVLDTDHVRITGRRGARAFECSFELRDIAPHFERIRGRYARLVVIPLMFASLVSIGMRLFLRQGAIPHEVGFVFGSIAIIFFLIQAVKGFAPLEIIQFHSKQGGVIFDVIKESKQAEECERFVAELRCRIQRW